MKSFHVSLKIPASAEKVWAVLTNSSLLASGPFGITRLDGEIAPGKQLKLWTEATGSRAFPLKVSVFTPAKEMVWEGGMPLGLFRGIRRFTLTPQRDGVVFEMREDFSGPFSPLISRAIPDLTPSFERFANALSTIAQEKRS